MTMENREAEALKRDLEKFLEATTVTIASFKERLEMVTAPKMQSRTDGIVLDYKTFTEVVNALTINPETQELAGKVIAIGSKQFEVPQPKVEQPRKPVSEAAATKPISEVNAERQASLPPFIQALIDAGLARVSEEGECDCPACRAAREGNFSGHTDEEIEEALQKQFPGAKIVKDPMELLAYLRAIAEMEKRNGGRGPRF